MPGTVTAHSRGTVFSSCPPLNALAPCQFLPLPEPGSLCLPSLAANTCSPSTYHPVCRSTQLTGHSAGSKQGHKDRLEPGLKWAKEPVGSSQSEHGSRSRHRLASTCACKEESDPTGTEQSDLTPGGPGHIHGSDTSCVTVLRLWRYLDTGAPGAHDSSGTIYREARDKSVSQGTWQPTWQPTDHWSSSTSPSTQIPSHFLSLGLPCKMGDRLLSGSAGWTGRILTGWAVPGMQGQTPGAAC